MRHGVIWLLLCVVTGICLAQVVPKGTTSEQVLRAHAVKIIHPSFPADASLRHKTGVAVAQVQLDVLGQISRIQILEVPTPSIAQSVSEAVSQWKFTPFNSQSGTPMILSAKLTFYFEIKAGKALVLDPVDAGYVGSWPENSKKQKTKNDKTASNRLEYCYLLPEMSLGSLGSLSGLQVCTRAQITKKEILSCSL